jgi:hypothetical protein
MFSKKAGLKSHILCDGVLRFESEPLRSFFDFSAVVEAQHSELVDN